MKRTLLLTLIIALGAIVLQAQQPIIKESIKTAKASFDKEGGHFMGVKDVSNVAQKSIPAVPAIHSGNSRDITIKSIGNSANAYSYGYAGGQTTILWVDPQINTIAHFHRMTADSRYSGDLAMDVSKDGGESWENNIMIYESTISGGEYNLDAIRYPQGVLYNPPGNTDPDNAKAIFHGPNLDGSNSDVNPGWGGYSYGYASLGDYSDTSKHLLSSDIDNGYYQYIPDAMTITHDGRFWIVDPADDWTTGELNYTGNLIINKGTFSESEGDVTFEQSLLDAPVVDTEDLSYTLTEKVAFSPDGETGYIVMLSNDESVPFSSECLYPIVFKSTDGGETWENKGGIQLGGPDGIDRIVDSLLTQQQIEEIFEEPLPNRDEIQYTTAFDFDMVVDNNGELHIAAVVGVKGSDPYSIATGEDYMSAMDIFSVNGGNYWKAVECRGIKRFRGNFGDISEDNRIQASATPGGEVVFVSWLDTDPEFSDEENNQPDIWTCGIDLDYGVYGYYTDPINVTEFTEAWGAAFFAIAPEFVFNYGDSYEVPFTYQDMDPNDPVQPVQYKYIQDFTVSEMEFTNSIIGIINSVKKPVDTKISVSQNVPNPFDRTTSIEVQIPEREQVTLDITNMIGQTVYRADKGEVPAGKKNFTVDASNLNSGAYFYTVTVGNNKVTKKMIVK